MRERGFPDEVPYNVFRYRVIRVWQLPPDPLLTGGLGTLPLAPISAVTVGDLLVRLGSKPLGWPSARTQAALEMIPDLDRLEALIERIGAVESWQALLAEAKPDR